LSATYGRGAATSFQEDIQNSDCVLIMGSNMAEAHPVGFRFVMKARERGARVIHVDPHFSRTSACATDYVPIRTGTDIVFLGGIINKILREDRYFKEYVLAYTNASTIINDKYVDAEDAGGIFSGYDPGKREYDIEKANWHYEGVPPASSTESPEGQATYSWSKTSGAHEEGEPERDPTLQHPMCVMNVLKRHYARYTPEMVAQTCGCSIKQFENVAEAMIGNSGRERTGVVVYALGWTQHSTGVQIIRTAAMMQLLLGNVGRPGAGVMAMRGHASIQGSTDIPTLYNLLPGYIPQPDVRKEQNSLGKFLQQETVEKGYWANMPKFVVSLLKAWYGQGARPENDFGFGWIPRINGDHSHLVTFTRMAQGEVKGLFLLGQNPAAGAPNARLHREGLKKLEWMVVRDFFLLESAEFWHAGPENPDPRTVGTEVFFLPAAAVAEKPGTLTNTQRMLQWHDKAVDPPGDCRSDLWFMWNLGRRLKEMYRGSGKERDGGLLNMTWDYGMDEAEVLPDGSRSRITDEPSAEKVLKEINGYALERDEQGVAFRGRQLRGFEELKDDGSTASGCWIYCGVWPEEHRNRSADRSAERGRLVNPEWAWAWPANRRMMYNRASADPEGRPWSERKKYIWWDEAQGKWTGHDIPDFPPDKAPGYRSEPGAKGMEAISGDSPFIMHSDGKGWLFAPSGVKDGPLPTHYEPVESPVGNPLYMQRESPTARVEKSPLNEIAPPMDPRYPVVATTYRLTEHYLSGGMSRFDSWLNELQPAMFVEMSPELAQERGIEHGGWVVLSSPRGDIEARAMVTPRLHTLNIEGKKVHQIGVPIHFSFTGEVTGGQANDLIPIITEPNVSMHEGKSFVCEVRPGRLARAMDRANVEVAARPTEEPMPDTPHPAQPEGRTA
jgi:formate dehydrogenase major subunit